MTCRESADLGAYLLGALEPGERRQVEEHLRRCPSCRAEADELAALPDLLALVDPDDLRTPPVTPSPDLFARVSAAAGRPRQRRRRLLIAAALVLLAAGVATGIAVGATGTDGTTVSASSGGVELTVTATEGGGGTVLRLAVDGLPPDGECRLVVVDRAGREHPAGKWAVGDDGAGTWRGWADVDADAVTGVVLLDAAGRELVRARL